MAGEGILPLFACLYWCIDQHKCIAGIWLVPLNEISNGCVKWLVRRARPAWVDGRVKLLAWSDEFSFPSSHSQLTGAVMHFFVRASYHPEASSITPSWVAYAFVVAVALSRVHVGVHYPTDVVVGAASGILSAAVYEHYLHDLYALAPARSLGLLLILLTPTIVAALAVTLSYQQAVAAAESDSSDWTRLACRGKYSKRQ